MDILNQIMKEVNKPEVMRELSKSTGADAGQIQEAMKLGLPTLLEAMTQNSGSSRGAQSLSKALDDHKNTNVEDLAGFFKNVDRNDGSKILGHIFGSDNKNVQRNFSKQTGLDTNQSSSILSMLTPLLMGFLAKQKSSQRSGSNDLQSMLTGMLAGAGNKGIMDSLTKVLDSDGDGKIMDDLGKLAGKLFKK